MNLKITEAHIKNESAEASLKHYKDFDIVKEIKDKGSNNLLWCRARSIDADVCNANGDYFEEKELLKEIEISTKDENNKVKKIKVPVYKTFEGVPIFRNHDNKDITKAMGAVVYAEWDNEQKCVYCTFYIDGEAYPDIVRAIKLKYITDVSMGCSIQWGECNICNNKAYSTDDYCDHQKKHKARIDPVTRKKVYELNKEVKFFELSVVRDGAFENCEIEYILSSDDIISRSEELEGVKKKAFDLSNQIPKYSNYDELNEFIKVSNSVLKSIDKFSQVSLPTGAGLLAQDGATQNSTVSNILNFLGIDVKSGLNILDLLNLALNFLEVAVLNLFSRKDNVDLAHVAKITKTMGDLQNVMQDVIDEGLENNVSAQNGVQMQPQQPFQQPQQIDPNQINQTQGAVGKIISPNQNIQTQTQALPLGGGVVTANIKWK